MYLQNGLYIIIEKITVKKRIKTFHLNKNPAALRKDLFKRTNGIPPSSVPAGHINLQNHGNPSPVISSAASGRIITKTARMIKRRKRKNFSPGRFLIFFINGILKSKS